MRSAFKVGVCAVATLVTVGAAVGASSAETRAPKTVEVRMTNEGDSVRFEPREITIAAGDTVKWLNVGGSHNIVFWPDSVPEGAVALLRAAMPDTVGALESPRFRGEASYSVVFAGMPKGVYKYRCQPHLRRGMVGTITIQ